MQFRVKTCCGCFDLRTGTLIVGICGIFFSGVGIFTHIYGLGEIKDETTKQEVEAGIGFSYVYVVNNVLLIYGAFKESKYFLLPWLIYVAVGLGVASVILVISVFFSPILLSGVILCACLWYVWTCVLSYYYGLSANSLSSSVNVYTGVSPVCTMVPTVVTYVPQPIPYAQNTLQVL